MFDMAMRDAGARRPLEPRGVGPVAEHEHDLGRIGRIGRGIDQRLQVGPASGDQNSDFEPCHAASARAGCTGRSPAVDGVAAKTAVSRRQGGREPRRYGTGNGLQ